MTMEASTIMPTPRIRPVSVIMFSVIPAKFMHRSVIRIESGIEIEMMTVLLKFWRKTNSTMTARISP